MATRKPSIITQGTATTQQPDGINTHGCSEVCHHHFCVLSPSTAMPSTVLAKASAAVLAVALYAASTEGATLPEARQSPSPGVTFKGSSSYSKGRMSAAFSGDASNTTGNTIQDSQDLIVSYHEYTAIDQNTNKLVVSTWLIS